MPLLLRNISMPFDKDEEHLRHALLCRYTLEENALGSLRLLRKALDARKKGQIKYVYTVVFTVENEAAFIARHGSDPDLSVIEEPATPTFPRVPQGKRLVIVGAGPAGLFAALRLSEYGLTATLVERGKPVDDRLHDVQTFWSTGILDGESNVQFGEGGAGTFSDGKLTTRVRDENITYILSSLVKFGAPEEILWLGKPHIGTDRLRTVVKALRCHLEQNGITIRFGQRMAALGIQEGRVAAVRLDNGEEILCDQVIVAPGHSARDTYELLHQSGVRLEQKPFAVGVRVEHPQEHINTIQYGIASHPRLPAADYAVTYNDIHSGRSAYSFCMCPGGVVVAAASEKGGVVTNGMSGHLRNSPWANSALVVTVGPADFPHQGPLAGIEFQRLWERRAFDLGGGDYHAPAQNLLNFLGKKGGVTRSSYRPGVREVDVSQVLPEVVTKTLRDGIQAFERRMRGFITAEATLTGVETRTSAPVRIVRGSDYQSVTLKGLYPAGEGAGYAGGIVSAALDGIRVADAIAVHMGAT